jgi:hypothetical protein
MLVGVAPTLDARQREGAAALLNIPGQLLQDQSRGLLSELSYRSLAQATCAVLEALVPTPSLFDRLAESGQRHGLWPVLHRWDGATGQLRLAPFCQPRTRAPPGLC